MQAWELEKEMFKAQDKLEEIRKFVDAHLEEGAPEWATFLLKEIKMILEDSNDCID